VAIPYQLHNFPQSIFNGKTIIPRSVEICNTAQYKILPIFFIALILIPYFLKSYIMMHCVDVKSAQAMS
jgi:hypothetical protein